MVEPTETESRETLEEAVNVYKEIYRKALAEPDSLHLSPVNTPVGRPDEVLAARNPVVRYQFGKEKA